ncbi:dienelactone hydrolase family protein [Hirschia baltica]|uniref:Dienelactone hydrolase n=1 Tax=Hirschia baltica (strain ATCC 49814 / DSM 5838 / IFAM 1418) TaxID=582402 RepID=C6XMY5_HIRBI|nr:dienelactone hydrolase family protein [Hirschia baltica]ACT58155.1 dienelactone hydrolase [Hirschia baltica ATCC 49814]
MSIQSKQVEYRDGDTNCIGLLAWDDQAGKRPCVLVAPDWRGRTQFSEDKAIELAKLGYVGFAIDVYGEGRSGKNADENAALMNPFMEDRAKLKRRLLATLGAAREFEEVEADKMSILGFCFGGLCALDLARAGEDIKAAISFHGLFIPNGLPENEIKASVLALHGYDDPKANPESVLTLGEELTRARCDWQIHAYGQTMHSFMNPKANAPENGLQYSPIAEKRAWLAATQLLGDVFG